MTDQPAETDTSEDNLIPQGQETHLSVESHAILQVTKLAGFLMEFYPDEVALSNRQTPETPVDTAIRLILSLSATAPRSGLQRCQEDSCNKPQGHQDVCGWVQSD